MGFSRGSSYQTLPRINTNVSMSMFIFFSVLCATLQCIHVAGLIAVSHNLFTYDENVAHNNSIVSCHSKCDYGRPVLFSKDSNGLPLYTVTVKADLKGNPDSEDDQYAECMIDCMGLSAELPPIGIATDHFYTFGRGYDDAREVLEALVSEITSDIAESDWTDVDLSNGYYSEWDDDEVVGVNNDTDSTMQSNPNVV